MKRRCNHRRLQLAISGNEDIRPTLSCWLYPFNRWGRGWGRGGGGEGGGGVGLLTAVVFTLEFRRWPTWITVHSEETGSINWFELKTIGTETNTSLWRREMMTSAMLIMLIMPTVLITTTIRKWETTNWTPLLSNDTFVLTYCQPR